MSATTDEPEETVAEAYDRGRAAGYDAGFNDGYDCAHYLAQEEKVCGCD